MRYDIYNEFVKAATAPCNVIVEDIVGWEQRLEGKLPILKAALGRAGRDLGLDIVGRSESESLRVILLSAIVTAFDPHLSGSPIGERHRKEISEAATILGASSQDIKPLSSVEDALFSTLNTYLVKR